MSVKKEAVSVRKMAQMVDLSRARFYQLMQTGIFPPPLHDAATGRPFYSREIQELCLNVRRRNCGVNGKPIVFYKKQIGQPKTNRSASRYGDLIKELNSYGLSGVTTKQVAVAIKRLYPDGIKKIPGCDVVKNLFLTLYKPEYNE